MIVNTSLHDEFNQLANKVVDTKEWEQRAKQNRESQKNTFNFLAVQFYPIPVFFNTVRNTLNLIHHPEKLDVLTSGDYKDPTKPTNHYLNTKAASVMMGLIIGNRYHEPREKDSLTARLDRSYLEAFKECKDYSDKVKSGALKPNF